LRVASHSDSNGMSVGELGDLFSYTVLRGNPIFEKGLVVEDLIRNVHTLFDEQQSPSHSPSPPVPVSETTSTADSATRHLSTHTQSSFSASPSDFLVQWLLTPIDPLAKPPTEASVVNDSS